MTTITLTDVAIGSGPGAEVAPLSFTVDAGAPTVVAVETDERPMLVSLLLAGRVKPDEGAVTIDSIENVTELRRRTALIDTPFVAEPTPGVSLAVIVAEDLSFAGRPASRNAVAAFLASCGLAESAGVPVRAIGPAARVRLFCELALLRTGVTTLIVTSPERHGGEPSGWYPYLADLGERGITVAVVTDAATSDRLISLGARDAFAATIIES